MLLRSVKVELRSVKIFLRSNKVELRSVKMFLRSDKVELRSSEIDDLLLITLQNGLIV